MNRRDLFKFLGASAGAAALWVPSKSIFLPPRGGWYPYLRLREVQQYLINNDSLAMQWAAKWELPNGSWEQFHVTSPEYPILHHLASDDPVRMQAAFLESHREIARELIAKKIPKGAKMVDLNLPSIGPYISRYV